MNTFYIETYGCQMNEADSESIAAILSASGLREAVKPEDADLIVVNTCAVRDSAVSRVKAQISRFRPMRKKRGVKIAVAGCLAEHEREKLLAELAVDYVVGPDHYRFLADLTADRGAALSAPDTDRDFYADFPPARKTGVNAWIPVMRGCDNFCSYCVVPLVRGREKSKPKVQIVEEVRRSAGEGRPEVTLLGQNVNSWRDGQETFPDLLDALDEIEGLGRVRFMTSHPKDLSPALIDRFGRLRTLCEHLHLPVQSGSDAVLGRMNRGYTRDGYRRLVGAIRARVPDIALTTDVLCGFPGETDDDHEATMSLVREVGFDAAFMFIYSPRTGTAAAGMPGQLHRDIKVARVNEVIRTQMEITRSKNGAYTGRTVEVLVEGRSARDPGLFTGRTRAFKNVILPGTPETIGRFRRARITGTTGWALLGTPES